MHSRRLIVYGVALLCICCMLASCHTAVVHKSTPAVSKKGPPPHAPAHGYRHKHADGVELVYDKHLCVYTVSGYANYYFYKDHYFRLQEESWTMSSYIKGPWKKAPHSKLPKGLKNQKVAKGKSNKK